MVAKSYFISKFISGLTTLDVDHTLNLGGLETFPTFFPDPEDIDPHFEGCMRNLKLNGKEYPLTVEAGWRGLSIGKLTTIRPQDKAIKQLSTTYPSHGHRELLDGRLWRPDSEQYNIVHTT